MGEECDVSPYLSEYEPMKGIKATTALCAYDDTDTRETIIQSVNQGLFFGDRLSGSLMNHNQLRNHGLYLNDNPFKPGELFGIHNYEINASIPFMVCNVIISFKTRAPTDTEIK